MFGVAVVDMLPGGFHAFNFGLGGFVELAKEGVFKFGRGGAGKHAGDIHVRVAGAGKAEINHADDFVVFIE